MKPYQRLLLLTGILVTPLAADTIVLKTGVKYEGKVISEDATSYTIQIHVTKSIKDERRILKDNVKEIIKETGVSKDYKNIGPLVPTPDRLTAENYELRIKKAKSFLAKHPKSTHNSELEAALDILEKEYAVVSKGGTKLNGQLITAADIKANAYDVHARIIAAEFRSLAKQGLHQPALRKWEELKNDYPHSTAYVESLPLVTRVLQTYLKQLDQQLETLDARTTKRDSVIKSLSDNDRSRAEQTIAQKKARYETLIQKEEKEIKTRWLTIDPYHERALEFNQRNTKSELQSVTRLDKTTIKLAGPTYRGAWTALAHGKLEEASKLVSQLKSFRLPEKYITPLTTKLEEKEASKKAEEEKAAAEIAEQKRQAKIAAEQAKKDAAEAKKKKPKGRKKK